MIIDKIKTVKVRYWVSAKTPLCSIQKRWRRGYHTLEEAKKIKNNIGVESNPWIKNCQSYKDYFMEVEECKITKVTEIKEEIL